MKKRPAPPVSTSPAHIVDGRIIQQAKIGYFVDTPRGVVLAGLKGSLRSGRTKPYTGDLVELHVFDETEAKALITKLYPRKNLLTKPVIANIDQIVFLASLIKPAVSNEMIDRFLFSVAPLKADSIIAFNKTDLLSAQQLTELQTVMAEYDRIGYHTICLSAHDKKSVKALLKLCKNKFSAFAGVSGVGKSTVLNTILPDADLATNEISSHIDRGTHTTTSSLMLKISANTYIADTPGFAFVNLSFVEPEDVILHFPELKNAIGECRFNNCLHKNEPGCVIKEMVDNGLVAISRYESYLKFYEEMCQRKEKRGEGWRKKETRRRSAQYGRDED